MSRPIAIGTRLQVLIACMCVSLFAAPVSALEYMEVSWGFDGKVVPDHFNLLTVVVRNDQQLPFDGVVKLEQTQGFSRLGAMEVERCYLAPGDTRTLQFYPRVTGSSGWLLSDGTDKEDIDVPEEGLPAIVRLVDGDDPLRSGKRFKDFPHQRFPTTVSATEGLFAAVIDYSPPFTPSQREAFIDWLRAGGRLHVFPDRDLQFPVIEELSAMEQSGTRYFGSGKIEFHGNPLASLTKSEADSIEAHRTPIDNENYYSSVDITLFQELQHLTQLDIAWPLVYLAAIVYIALLGPGQYLWVRHKKRDYRLVLIVLLGTVTLFSVVFAVIGRRGYGEKTQLSSVSLARHIEGQRYDVTSWANLFVTQGDDYTFRHSATHSLYSSGESYEPINASMMNGREGVMETEIPVFSSRTFVHRGVMNGMDRPEMLRDTGAGDQRKIEWKFPPSSSLVEAWVRIEGKVFPASVSITEGQIVMNGLSGYYADENMPANANIDDIRKLLSIGRKLFHRRLGMLEYEQPKWIPFLGEDHIELYVLATMPQSFQIPNEKIALQQGATLYRYRYPVNRNP